MSESITEADAARMRDKIAAALQEGVERQDPVIMILLDPPLVKEFHRLWDQWDLTVQIRDSTVRAGEFVTIVGDESLLPEERYRLVTRSDNERNFLLKHYQDFLGAMRPSPVQVSIEDLHQLYVWEQMHEFRSRGERGEH